MSNTQPPNPLPPASDERRHAWRAYEIGSDPQVDVVAVTPDGRVFVYGEEVSLSDLWNGESERRRAT
jgi:hypothetical protein